MKTNNIIEITELHEQIVSSYRASLKKALRIGELLQQTKDSLSHGNFGKWIGDNLPFTERTARNYMRVFNNQHLLKSETVSVLEAYKQLKEPSELEANKEQHKKDSLEAQKLIAELDQAVKSSVDLYLFHEILKKFENLHSRVSERRLRIERRLGQLISEAKVMEKL